MTEQDKKLIKELIEKYGVNKIITYMKQNKLNSRELESLVLEYLFTTNTDPITGKFVNPCVSIPSEGTQLISNGVSSLYEINEPLIQKDWLECDRKIMNQKIIYNRKKIVYNKEKLEEIVKDNCFNITMPELHQLVYQDKLFSIVELKLLKQLLQNPTIHMSKTGLAIVAESDKGSAYILGKDKNGQRTF